MELSRWSYGLLSKTRGRVVERAWNTASQFFESCCRDGSARHIPMSPAQRGGGACYAGVSSREQGRGRGRGRAAHADNGSGRASGW
jgi:hypothetical protein